MHCYEVRFHASEFVDLRLDDETHQRVSEHVAGCAECGAHVEAIRAVCGSLRGLRAPAPPSDLFESTLVALDREVEPEMTIITRRHFKLRPHYQGSLLSVAGQVLQDYEFKLIAYSAGLCLSLVLFGGMLASMRPLLSLSPFVSPSQQTVWMTPVESQALGTSFMSVHTLPRIAEAGTRPEVATAAPEWGNLVVIAEIAVDGRGSIVEVLNNPSSNHEAVGELAHAINQPRAFVPAYATSGRPIPTRVVLIVERVDVVG